jgi:hypothetical protein
MAILPTLSNPTLQVDLLTGSDMANVTLTVNLGTISPDFPSGVEVEASVWGLDGGFNAGDDSLLLFPKQTFLPPRIPFFNPVGIVTFSGVVPRAWLDEDNGNDEIYSRFEVKSAHGFPNNIGVITSPVLTGEFGID